jgi:hypothetical protein
VDSVPIYMHAVVGYEARGPDDHSTVSIAYTELHVTLQRESHKTYRVYVVSVKLTLLLQMCP